MAMTPLSLEIYARDYVRDRMADAEHRALVAQLPNSRPALSVARSWAAHGLRTVARRLDPSIVVEAARAATEARLAASEGRLAVVDPCVGEARVAVARSR